jgi:hypothetical protein
LFLLFCSSPSNNRAPIQVLNSHTDGSGAWSVSTPAWTLAKTWPVTFTYNGSSTITGIVTNVALQVGDHYDYPADPTDTVTGIVSATSVTLSTTVSGSGTVTLPFGRLYTNLLSAGFYPSCAMFCDGRLWIAGVPGQLNAIFASSIPQAYAGTISDYTTFGPGPDPTDSIYEIQSDISTPIQWVFGRARTILAGTQRGVWFDVSTPPPEPATFSLKNTSVYGAGPAKPQQVTNVTLYASADQRAFRALILNLYRGYYPDTNLAENCDHLMSRHVLDFCVTRHPETVAWLMMADGSLLTSTVRQQDTGFTVNSEAGFAQHILGGGGQVVALCSARNANWDEVWMLVKRTVNGSPVYSVEYLYLDDVNLTSVQDGVYLDNAITVQEGTPETTISGLSDLNGQQVGALADGYFAAVGAGAVGEDASGNFQTVSAGDIILETAASYITVGCPYYYAVRTLPPNTQARGTGQAKQKRLERAWVRAYNSVLFYVGKTLPANPLESQAGSQKALPSQLYGSTAYGWAQQFWSGDIPLPLAEGVDELAELYLYGFEPFGFNLNAIMGRVAVMEI